MPLVIPFHAQTTFIAQRALDEPVILLEVRDTHQLGSSVLRYCSYPVTRLQDSPLIYGLVSNSQTYIFALAGHLPSDEEGAATRSQLVLDNVDQEMTDNFMGLSANNVVTIILVLASTPNEVIRQFNNLRITEVTNSDQGELTVTVDRDPKSFGGGQVEPWPSGRQTIDQAPGLHRQ
jgi:hypothetical protein